MMMKVFKSKNRIVTNTYNMVQSINEVKNKTWWYQSIKFEIVLAILLTKKLFS